MRNLQCGDLFCGLGGFSDGLLRACNDLGRSADLLAINHWPRAIETHKLNHPGVSHLCENLDNVDPRKVHPGGKLDILLASPECTHFSRARGGTPMSDQSRSSGFHILRWAEALRIENILVENVREFQSWGPINAKGRPMESKKGQLFQQFCATLEAMGYRVDFRVLNSAHYGAATARERLFVQAVRRRRPRWPEQTHSAKPDLFKRKPYRAAREIIDWDLQGSSIFGRKKPLCDKTLKRIMAGLQKFGGVEFVLGQQSCGAPRSVEHPIPTIATAGAISLVQPFLVMLRNHADGRSLGTLDTSNRFGLARPFIVPVTHGGGEGRAYDVNQPLPTVTGAHRGEMALIDPYLVQYYGTSGAASCNSPLTTVTTNDRFGLVEPQPVAEFDREGVVYALMDIRFRMLQPHELAAAMGMAGYKFPSGATKADSVKMIGNAVECRTARALCGAVLQ